MCHPFSAFVLKSICLLVDFSGVDLNVFMYSLTSLVNLSKYAAHVNQHRNQIHIPNAILLLIVQKYFERFSIKKMFMAATLHHLFFC